MQGVKVAASAAAEPANLAAEPPTPSTSAVPPHTATRARSPSPAQALSKRDRIWEAAAERDIDRLRELAAEPGGFEDSELRRAVWPLLLRCDVKGKKRAVESDEKIEELADLLPRDDERQVRLDIVRSLVNYPQDVKEEDREALRTRLETAILTVLRRHPALHYFQGYHDIVSVLLLSLQDDELVTAVAERLSLHRIRDNMGAGLEPTLGYLKLVYRLVQRVDPELSSVINQAASMPFFALSWALTLFSHDLESVAVIARLFDFLLAHNPAMVVYLVVAILLTKKDDLLAVACRVGDDDPAIIHSALSQLPNIVLRHPPSPFSPPGTPTPSTPSSPPAGLFKSAAADIEYDEDLMSSASSSRLSDLTLSPSLTSTTGPSSPSELSESLISLSEASPSPSPSKLRQRRRVRSFSLSNSLSSFDDYDYGLDESMLTDPDCDVGLPSTSSSSLRRSPTPSPPRTPTHSTAPQGEVLRAKALASPSGIPPPRSVLADDLIASALRLWRAYPLVAASDASPEEAANALAADEVLGPLSCVFTFERSELGELPDEEAQRIVREGEGVVQPGGAAPDLPEEPAEAEADEGFEMVPSPTRRRRPQRQASTGRLNLGPHGWLVLAGGAAVATAAVAYGVYRQQAPVAGGGLGTAGVGLGAAGGALGGSQPLTGAGVAANAGVMEMARRVAEGREL
ncbi:hypothetical protein JCM10213_003632 [Rhodosporidiobolus nylandii]